MTLNLKDPVILGGYVYKHSPSFTQISST